LKKVKSSKTDRKNIDDKFEKLDQEIAILKQNDKNQDEQIKTQDEEIKKLKNDKFLFRKNKCLPS